MKREFYNLDCMDAERGLPSYPDKYFDLCIVDPPYGLNAWRNNGNNKLKLSAKNGYKAREWDKVPDEIFFDELFRISKNQIIFGGNYFNLGKCIAPIIWDKVNYETHFADGEYAWTSFKKGTLRIFRHQWAGFLTGGEKDKKIHETQKPIALYRWLLENYAKPGDLILDTHVGSASSLIACEALGFDYVGYEIDKDYYEAATKRLEKWRSLPLFDEPKKEPEQINLLKHLNTKTLEH